MTAPLPPAFLGPPIAHRGLHDAGRGRPENSRAAILAAAEAGYGVELDVQLSADGRAMVFHDHHLERLTVGEGPVRRMTAADLGRFRLAGTDERIPTLAEILEAVAGRVPILVEIKDQDGAMGPDVGALERAVAADLEGYAGPAAVMSFNPHAAALCLRLMPDRAVGLVTCGYAAADWPILPEETRERLSALRDADHVAFISHDWRDLDRARIAELKAAGTPVLCWTIRSAGDEARARRIADNVTFEGYLPPLPAA